MEEVWKKEIMKTARFQNSPLTSQNFVDHCNQTRKHPTEKYLN